MHEEPPCAHVIIEPYIYLILPELPRTREDSRPLLERRAEDYVPRRTRGVFLQAAARCVSDACSLLHRQEVSMTTSVAYMLVENYDQQGMVRHLVKQWRVGQVQSNCMWSLVILVHERKLHARQGSTRMHRPFLHACILYLLGEA